MNHNCSIELNRIIENIKFWFLYYLTNIPLNKYFCKYDYVLIAISNFKIKIMINVYK